MRTFNFFKKPPLKICILCNQREATTREHKILACFIRDITKKEDDKSVFIHKVSNMKNGVFNLFRTANNHNGGALKFSSKQLCAHCNNVYSSKMDKAFKDFIDELYKVNEEKKEDFCFRNGKNIFRYLFKVIMCRLDEEGFCVPNELREMILNTTSINYDLAKLSIALNEECSLEDAETKEVYYSWENTNTGRLGIKNSKTLVLEGYTVKGVRIDFTYKLKEAVKKKN
jgi:hypothetical protein